jgi:hypothetical protein
MTVTVSLVNGSPDEARTRVRLLALLGRYNLTKWQFTDQIQIEDEVAAHSHPVLTMNTRNADDDALLLAVYIHEQLHWFILANSEMSGCTIRAFRAMYPDVPVDFPEGCGSERSNYLHFLVCYFEYKGLIELLGPDDARATFERCARRPFYRFIYRAVLQDFTAMSAVITGCGLSL